MLGVSVGVRMVEDLCVSVSYPRGSWLGKKKAYLVAGDRLKLVIEDLDVDIGLIAVAVDSTLVDDIALISIS